MRGLYILWAISACVSGYVPGNSVKGGPSKYTNQQDNSNAYSNPQAHTARPIEVEEIGVCYIEVPTANLVNYENHVRGNGSRPDLSRIQICCRGYARNRYNPEICDPVCSKGCTNSYCVAPETCECYPDYEKNSAGLCTQTCPRSCQNGHCSGGDCICDFGYKWDSQREHCEPKCKDNCAGLGTCTAPNTCSCHPGYQSTAEGSCEPTCGPCEHGSCVANRCQCHRGYSKDLQGLCKPQCQTACPRYSECIGPNICSAPTTSEDSQQHYVQHLNSQPQYSANQVEGLSYQQQLNGNHIDTDRQSYFQTQNRQHPDGSQNLYNPYGTQSRDFYNQRSNDQSQQETYRRPQESYDHRNQGDRNLDSTPYDHRNQEDRNQDSTQHQTHYNQNQRSYDSSQHSYDSSCSNQHVNRNTQGTSSSGQYDTEYGRNQNQIRNVTDQFAYASPQQRPYDSSRRETEIINQGSYDSRQGSYGTNQRPYSGSNSLNNRRETPEVNNQMYSQPGSSHYPDQRFDVQQTNVPICSMPCINGHCVEGNQCSCKPGYITDRTNLNVCIPDCPGGCPNGVCSAPRLCLCNVGYHKDRSVKGRPVCVKQTR